MSRSWGIVAALLLCSSACTGNGVSPEEAAEINAEQTMGDEREMVGTNPSEMDGWMPPNAEEDVEMETVPYPE